MKHYGKHFNGVHLLKSHKETTSTLDICWFWEYRENRLLFLFSVQSPDALIEQNISTKFGEPSLNEMSYYSFIFLSKDGDLFLFYDRII